MAKLFGKEVKRDEILRKVGDISQIAGIRFCELREGNQRGVGALDFYTGTGFRFTVITDRGMDISTAEYLGQPLSWRSETGEVHPAYFEAEGLRWLRNFYGGLLVTCGLTYAGEPCKDEGKELGLHGRISNTPARNVSYETTWENDEYLIDAKGKVIEAEVFGENICLTRRISTRMGWNKLKVHDTVENRGYTSSPHMILYHINGGFPVIDEGSRLISPGKEVIPRDKEAEEEKETYHKFHSPRKAYKEKCYYHEMEADNDGNVWVGLVNENFNNGKGFGFYVKYSKRELPEFVQWKMMGEGTYVVGVEPANCRVEGRNKTREKGNLVFLEPGEKKEYHLEIGVLEDLSQIKRLEKRI